MTKLQVIVRKEAVILIDWDGPLPKLGQEIELTDSQVEDVENQWDDNYMTVNIINNGEG